MSQSLQKGLTNNHVFWKMVDSTDHVSPESALSAAIKLYVYGTLDTGTGVNFVSSGTGSLTNDITHVGASKFGVYQIALAKADLSDASAAWYDNYIIHISAAGADMETIVIDGGMLRSYLSDVASDTLSTMGSQFAVLSNYLSSISAIASDAHSAAILGASHASDAQSQALLASSRASDAHSAATVGNSRLLLLISTLSDVDSALTSQYSDLASKIGNVSVAIDASDISDIASAVAAAVGSVVSDAHSAAAQANSRILLVQSRLSDFNSVYTSDISDIKSALVVITSAASDAASGVTVLQSRIASAAVTASDLVSKIEAGLMSDIYSAISDAHSDLASKIGGITASVGASDISDIASAVAATLASDLSNIHSAAILAASHASNAQSQAAVGSSRALLIQSRLSDFNSVYTSDISDIKSALTALSAAVSDAHSAAILAASHASDAHSAAVVIGSMVSDIDSALTSQYSDLGSKIGAVSVSIGASDLSDLASQVVDAIGSATLDANVVQVNGITVTGSGTQANPWGPA